MPRTRTPTCTASRAGQVGRAGASARPIGLPRRASRRTRTRPVRGGRLAVMWGGAGLRWNDRATRERFSQRISERLVGVPAPVLKAGPAPSRLRIEDPHPVVDGGRFPAKRTVGDSVDVSADILRDGHDVLRAVVRYRGPGRRRWGEAPLTHIDAHVKGDRWAGSF